jgi:hypothetical protein
MRPVAETQLRGDGRQWFADVRGSGRRMGVTAHPDHDLVVLSLWSGETCTATFRLPMADATRMIDALSSSPTAP